MKYRPEVDGLRALAVIPVILFHAGYHFVSGGYVGVDVFFVISGYLITTIIYSDISSGTFSIGQFYERRARRILPALFFVSISCIPFALAWMTPNELKDFAQSLVSVSLFASNVLFWIETDYFAAAAELKPLLHTWSLAIEEQFYVLFPLLLLLLRNRSTRTLLISVILISVASFLLTIRMQSVDAAANFYLLPTRAWELGVGAMLAITAKFWSNVGRAVSEALSMFGLILILCAIVTFDSQTTFPGYATLLPVVGAALLIVSANPNTVVGKLLALPVFVKIGLISYSAYLWHWPLFAFARIRMFEGVSDTVYLTMSIATLILAYLTWRYVEAPFRRKGVLKTRHVFGSAGLAAMVVVGLGSIAIVKSGLPERFGDDWAEVSKLLEGTQSENDPMCIFTRDRPFSNERTCNHGSSDLVRTVVWGDSHAHAVALELGNKLGEQGEGLLQYSYARCAPAVGYYNVAHPDKCPEFNEEVLNIILGSSALENVILIARWPMFFEGVPFDNLEGGVEFEGDRFGLPIDMPPSFVLDNARIPMLGGVFRATIGKLVEQGKNVVLVYPIPEVGWNVPTFLGRSILYNSKTSRPLSTSHRIFQERVRSTTEQLDKISKSTSVVRIYPEHLLCNNQLPDRCIAQLNGVPLYYDDDHLNALGASILSDHIVSSMFQVGWFDEPGDPAVRSSQ